VFDVFIGHHENKIDSKGRVSIPADFRKVLDEKDRDREPGTLPRMVMIFGDDRRDFLEVMSMRRLAILNKKIRRLPEYDRRRLDLENMIYERAQQLVLDDTGRIVLPPYARGKLGLEDKALILGRGDTFRIWHPDTHATKFVRPPADPKTGYDPDKDPMEYIGGDDEDDEA